MKILIISRYFPPLQGIGTERIASWDKYFRKMGHETTVLTTAKKDSTPCPHVIEAPYFDPITFFGGEQMKQRLSERKSWLMRFYRTRMNERLPGRTDPWIIPAIGEIKKMSGYDLIISSYGPPSAHIAGYFAKKHLGGVWLADFRDLWVDNHNYQGLWPFTILEKWWEKKVCGKADALLTVSNGLKEVLARKYPQKEVIVIPNGYDEEAYLEASNRYFADRKKKFRMVYTGTIYEGRHRLEPLFVSLKNLIACDSEFSEKFELLFYGHPSSYLNDAIVSHHLQDVVFYEGLLPSDEIKSVQLSADAFLQIHFDYDRYGGLVSGKIYEYLFAGKPILGVGIPEECELGQLIRSAGAGPLCKTGGEIQKTLLALMEKDTFHKSGQGFIERYSRKRQAEEIIAAAKAFSQRMISSSWQASKPKT